MNPVPAVPRMDAEVLVIGSGAGGATTATVLAESGFDVLVVEEGPWVEQGSVVPFSLEQMDRQYRAGGVTVALGRPAVAYTEGRCAGGGTEVNSGLYFRPPADTLAQWRDESNLDDFEPDELLGIADEVEVELSVSTGPGGHSASSEMLRRGAARLGWRHDEIPRWMTHSTPDPTKGQRSSMTRTYLPRAQRAGARLAVGCRVDRLVRSTMSAARADRAEVTLADGQRGTISFRWAFVCGGAIQTPALLLRSGVDGYIGRSLAVHPTVKLAARFPERINVPDDVPVHQVKEFAPLLSFGGSASNPGLVALSLLDHWAAFGPAVSDWQRMSVYYAAITSEGRGRVRTVRGLADPVVTYRLTPRDHEVLRSGLSRLAHLMLEAGADTVFPSFRGAPAVRRRRDLATLQQSFRAHAASVMTVHLCSTVPSGSDPTRSGTDSFGRVHALENVYVNDASLLPSAPGVNPQATVMAFAIRNARRFAAHQRHGASRTAHPGAPRG